MDTRIEKGQASNCNQSNTPLQYEGKDRDVKNQLKTIFLFLQEHTATASMISAATGIPQKNICRYKRDLENRERLWEVEKKHCRKTGFKAWYLTTNRDKAPFTNQLNLFENYGS